MEEPKKILLLFGTLKKVVEVSQSVECFNTFLADKAKELCHSPFVLQYFDEDFEEWCNIDNDYVPHHKEKLQVVLIDNPESMDNQEQV